MGDRDDVFSQDDLDIEITDLDPTSTTNQPSRFPILSRPLWALPPPLRQRIAQLTLAVSVVTLSMLMVLGNFPTVRTVAVSTFFPPTPTPTPTLVPGLDLFYFAANPSWGHLVVDGKPVPHLPSIGDAPLRLVRGRHLLRWLIEPFQPQRCTLSVPPQFNRDTCQIGPIIHTASGIEASLIVFSASLAMLPDVEHDTLILAVQNALDAQKSTETVQPGEAYAVSTNERHFDVAIQPMHATLRFQLDTTVTSPAFCMNNPGQPGNVGQSCTVDEQDCRLFCSADGIFQSGKSEWNVFGVVRFVWDYTTSDGRYVAGNQPDTTHDGPGIEHLVPLRITWDRTTWTVVTGFTNANIFGFDSKNPVCSPAQDELETLIQTLPGGSSMDVQFYTGRVHAAGCLVLLNPGSDSSNTSPSSQSVAYCLYRFGVFVAVNDVAHKFWPDMRLADTYERELAHQMLLAGV